MFRPIGVYTAQNLNTFLKSVTHEVLMTSSYATRPCPTFAVILSGCGVNDGTDIHEGCSVLKNLTRNRAVPHCYAPNIDQMDVVDHLRCQSEQNFPRNVLVESARIARGQILDLCELEKTTCLYDALIMPGGFGVTKNLSNFTTHGIECTVNPSLSNIIKDFHSQRKPIGCCGIAPILVAKVLCDVNITLGRDGCEESKWPYRDAIKAAIQMGARVESRDVDEVCYDCRNQIYSTPAYMCATAKFFEVCNGINGMIKYMLEYMRKIQNIK